LQTFYYKLEDQTVAFRQGQLFSEWRAIVCPFVVAPSVVEHFERVS
jgi:hypothetical protein